MSYKLSLVSGYKSEIILPLLPNTYGCCGRGISRNQPYRRSGLVFHLLKYSRTTPLLPDQPDFQKYISSIFLPFRATPDHALAQKHSENQRLPPIEPTNAGRFSNDLYPVRTQYFHRPAIHLYRQPLLL